MDNSAYQRIKEKIARYKAFYASSESGLMVRALISRNGSNRRMPLTAIDWSDPNSCRAYAISKLEEMQAHQHNMPDLDDDNIPKIQNLAGTGTVAAAYVRNAEVNHTEDTNYLKQPICEWERDLERIGFNPDNPWYKAQMWMLRALIEEWDGTYGIVPYTHFDPLDLCNQWRGNDVFYDYTDNPEQLGLLLEKATDAVLELETHMRANYMDGYPLEGCAMGSWTPGNYLSCDVGDMSSPATLKKWGVPHTQRIVQNWGGAYLHHHELGIHQISTWSDCKELSLQFLNRDPNTAHMAQTITEEQLETSFKVAIGFIATYDEFLRSSDYWATGKCCVTVQCNDAAQACNVAKLAAQHRI
jgi:hypothetical protein